MRLKSIPLLLLSLCFLGCKTEEQERQAHLEALLSCKPEIPLSKGELYELAMQDYWNNEMKWVWKADKELTQEWGYQDDDLATRMCGLKWTLFGKPYKITKDICYPWKVEKYEEFSRLSEKNIDFTEKFSNFIPFIRNLEGIVYDPEKDIPLYTEKFHNKNVDFSVIHLLPGSYNVYPKDCCKLMSYEQSQLFVKQKYHNRKGTDEYNIYISQWKYSEQFKDYYFLVIKTLSGYPLSGDREYRESYDFYPISHCGNLIIN